MPVKSRDIPDKPRGRALLLVAKFVRLCRRLLLSIKVRGKVSFGINSYIGKRADVYIPTSAVIGDNVSIASDFFSQVDFVIGNNSLISSKVSFIGNDHDLSINLDSAYHSGRLPPSKIVLEGNNFIGFGSTILGDVNIGYGSVIAANSFVNKNVPAGVVVAGIPAKEIKKRADL